MTAKVWFITGASRGFGHEWTRAALSRGDKVAATARDVTTLSELQGKFGDSLLTISLDVTDRAADIAAVGQAYEHFGQLDVVVNNAGHGQFGCLEELTEAEVRDQMETNFFGALWITQAALPYLRGQRSGHIVQVSSAGGLMALPGVGAYHGSKFALEGLSEALAAEVQEFGIHVTLVEPGLFATDWSGPSARRSRELPAYKDFHAQFEHNMAELLGVPGDPTASASALLEVVDADDPPLRVLFGARPLSLLKTLYEDRMKLLEEWQPVAVRAQG
jgi:NAD(P)-dependent dehydrogenase (short-subunit alcohol dehydrogenase family)